MSVWDLWLPILATGLATHVLSTIAWVALPHHKPEWKHLGLTGDLDEAIRSRGARPGDQYVLSTSEDDNDMDPSKCRGMLILWRHTPSMPWNIGMTLAFFLTVALAIGYLASLAFTRDAAALDVFRFTFVAALLTHAAGGVPLVIWFRRKCLMDFLDGAAYALATGAVFALLWPR